MTARVLQFDEATRRVTQDRGSVYGPPSVDFDRAARLKAVVAECQDARIRHALEMICVKMARLIQTPEHLDSWIDIAGYARTGVMVLDEVESQMPPLEELRAAAAMLRGATVDEEPDLVGCDGKEYRPHPLAGDPIEEQTFAPLSAADWGGSMDDSSMAEPIHPQRELQRNFQQKLAEASAAIDAALAAKAVKSPGLTLRAPEEDKREWDYERGRWYVAPKVGDRVKSLVPTPRRCLPGVIRAVKAAMFRDGRSGYQVEFGAQGGWYWLTADEFRVLDA